MGSVQVRVFHEEAVKIGRRDIFVATATLGSTASSSKTEALKMGNGIRRDANGRLKGNSMKIRQARPVPAMAMYTVVI